MGTFAEEQAVSVQPPRRGEIIALGIDTTARAYDLGSLAIEGFTPEADAKRRHEVWVTLQADGGDVYYYLSDGSNTSLDTTAAITAGNALAYANTYAAKLKQDDRHEFRIDRSRDTHLVVRTASGTATLRFWGSSNPMG